MRLRRKIFFSNTLLLAFLFLGDSSLFAQKNSQSVSNALVKIEALISEGNFPVAIAEATNELKRLPRNDPGVADMSRELGKLYRMVPCSDSEKESMLAKSFDYYEQALRFAPNDAATRMGFAETLVRLGKDQDALNSYGAALDDPSAKEDAAWGIYSLYQSPAITNAMELILWADRFHTNGMIEVAARSLERAIAVESSSNIVSDRGFLAFDLWIEAQAERKALTPAELNRLSGPLQTSKALVQWREKLANLEKPGAFDPTYWRSSAPGQHITAFALLSLARKERAAKRVNNSANLCEEALQIAPGSTNFTILSRPRPFVRLDIYAELASLYHAYPSLDPKTNKFKSLEDRLFDEKMGEYRKDTADPVILEKFHTTLALIYAERGKWERDPSDGDQYRNATFQMANAIRFSDTNSARAGSTVKALPQFREAYGLALAKKGPDSDAQKYLLDAAQGYLDYEDLNRAQKALDGVSDVARKQNKPIPDRGKTLKAVIDKRKDAMNVNLKGAPLSSVQQFKGNQWPTAAAAGVDSEFLARQQSRTLDDLTIKAVQSGNEKVAEELKTKPKLYAPAVTASAKANNNLAKYTPVMPPKITPIVDPKSPKLNKISPAKIPVQITPAPKKEIPR